VLITLSQVNWASSVNRVLCTMCSHHCSHSQNRTHLAWTLHKRCCTLWRWFRWKQIILMQNSPYLCLCCTTNPANSAHTCTWASLGYCLNGIFSTLSLFAFCIHSLEDTSLPQNSVYLLIYLAMWNSVKWTSLLPYQFHCRNHIQNACWRIHHFDYNCTAPQHSHPRLDSVQAGTVS
jgi:hypothetical protein